ncbi:hypothetical protein Tco_1009679, partial [Tanacetum coccineum]
MRIPCVSVDKKDRRVSLAPGLIPGPSSGVRGDQHIDVGALPKFDMPLHTSDMTAKDVKSSALRHGIPLDLHPVALTKEWTMDKLPDDMIGLYEQYFEFSRIRVPFSAFLLVIIKYFCVHISQLVPLGLNRLTMFELYCRSL